MSRGAGLAGRAALVAEHRTRQPRGALQQGAPLLGRRPPQAALEELVDDAEREVDLELAGARRQAVEAAGPRTLAGLGEQRRLADPRRPFEHEDPPRSLAGVGQDTVDVLKLA